MLTTTQRRCGRARHSSRIVLLSDRENFSCTSTVTSNTDRWSQQDFSFARMAHCGMHASPQAHAFRSCHGLTRWSARRWKMTRSTAGPRVKTNDSHRVAQRLGECLRSSTADSRSQNSPRSPRRRATCHHGLPGRGRRMWRPPPCAPARTQGCAPTGLCIPGPP